MVFKRFIEIGRVAYIAHGKDAGKLCVVVDIVDQARVLVDGPCSGVMRQAVNMKRLHLTKFVLKIPHSVRTKIVRKAWEKDEITKKWQDTTWAKKIVIKEKRAQLTDFDRFKLMKAKQARGRIIRTQYNKMKKEAAKAK
ncbi:large ribosomal subunit protein eL14-like [Saccoglossus kowalevskii]|uniref:Large ribosomal subunit protein eL14 n=1 Tax=Saccoglossus kowalevskii TaxID=10224 RepID=A0ABM0H0H7_SACKO|nr:PREDICTED: 60S ribosomal protein L14-like [Saccoglossus kowalevskii]